MKHGMFQRSVSLLLALVMILGNVPMNALAAEGEETTAPACEHSYDAVTTDATCSQDGSVVYTCACGDTYTETIPATGEHAWGDWTVTAEATYEAAGLETRACGCGATEEREIPQLVAAHEHAWGDWTVAAEATYEAAGLETRTCECGETENREIPQLVKVKAELSGNTRKLYFLNTEAWEEVHVFWSFEEEDFEDVAFPGVKMEADEDLENVFVVELPVEADAVTFNDGVEVTEELKTYERENGIEAIHFFAAELSAELDYFSAAEQVEDENNATEWLSYEDVLAAWEAEIAAVQALIDALPTVFASEAEVDAFWTSTEALDAAIEALTEAQQAKLDQSNYEAAIDAAAAFANPEFDDAITWEHNNIRLKDGVISVYDLFVTYGKQTNVLASYRYKDANGNTSSSYDIRKLTGNVTLSAGTYTIEKKAAWDRDWSSTGNTITVTIFHSITVDVTNDPAPAGSGIKINGTVKADGEKIEVDYGTPVSFEGVAVKGYTIESVTGVTSPVTASGTVSITYKANVAHEITVVNNEEAGSVNVPESVADGESLTITVTPKTGDGYAYYVRSVVVNDVTYTGNTVTIDNVTDAVTVKVTYGKHTLDAKNGTVYMNLISADLSPLKGKVLEAAGLSEGDYKVTWKGLTATYDLDDLGLGTATLWAAVEAAIGTKGTVDFTIIDNNTGVSKKVTMTFGDTRYVVTVNVDDLPITAKEAPADLDAQVKGMISITYDDPTTTENDNISVALDADEVTVDYDDYAWPADGKTAEYTIKVTVGDTLSQVYQTKSGSGKLTLTDNTILYTVVYTDGIEDEEIFADQTIGYTEDEEMPAFVGEYDVRDYYSFDKWVDVVEGNTTTRTATWTIDTDNNGNDIPDETETYRVIYKDGKDGEIFADDIHADLKHNDVTPTVTAFETPSELNFLGWTPTWAARVEAPAEGTDIIYTATWSNNWAVQFVGHTYKTPAEVEDGKTVAEPVDTWDDDHDFLGWYIGDNKYDFTQPVTGNLTLVAKWMEDYNHDNIDDAIQAHYDVTYMDGTEVLKKFEKVLVNLSTPTIENPTKNDYLFIGWTPAVAESVTSTATYVAQWKNDINNNGVADDEETITIAQVGTGEIAVAGAEALQLSTADKTSYVFDSTNPTITITATPVVDGKLSETYVQSVKIGEETVGLSYGDQFVATAIIDVENGDVITVTFSEAKLDLYENRVMNYYAGMKNVAQKDLYETLAAAPAYDDADEITITYKAREQMTHKIPVSILKSGEWWDYLIDMLADQTIDGILEDGNILITMDPLWLNVDVENKDPFPESVSLEVAVTNFLENLDLGDLIEDIIAKCLKGDWTGAGQVLSDFFAPVYESAMYYEAHRFGHNTTGEDLITEEIKVTYKSDAVYLEEDTTVELRDQRLISTIGGNNVTVTYKDYTDAELLAAMGIQVNEVPGAKITCEQINEELSFEGKPVSQNAYELKFKFAGNDEYRPAEAKYTVTVAKASLSMDVADAVITHGEAYNQNPVYTKGNKYGNDDEINESLIRFIVGLDAANFDVDKDGVHGLNGKVQLILTDSLTDLLNTALKLLNQEYEDGMQISLSDLSKYLGVLGDTSVESLNQILESIAGITELGDLTITLGGTYPTATGAYLHGAVSTNPNYETAFDIGYILIAPETSEYTLKWKNETLTNGLVTLPAFRAMEKGAYAVEDETFQAGYVILGINDKTGDIYTTDIYGNINLNIWSDPDQINDNGGYVQLAYGLNYGDNQLVYAKPIVRSFAIVPGITEMEIVVDNQATADLYKTVFDNAPVDVTVRGVIPEGGQVKFHYYGIEANTKTYDSDIAPTHTGAYAITASLVTRDAETGDMTSVGLDVATVVIQPTESSVTMKELQTVVFDGENHNVADTMEITASSTVENLKPDTTVITASIATDGSFSENGWAAVQGTVNVDFPRWMDELIGKYAPSVKDGITLSELEAKLLNKLPTITDKLEELGATNEMVNSTKNLLTNVSSLLEEMPADAVLSFKDDYEVLAVGTYAVAAVVTDSDHIPSVDAGLLVIVPDADQVFLDWDYHDENNIWSRELLSNVSINATAFNDKAFTEPNAQATAKITYQFIGLDQDAGLKIYTDPAQLPNGIYTQIAYIELEVDSQIVLSDIITRTIVIVPNMPELQIVDSRGAAQDKFEFTFDNAPVELYVKQNGQTIENQIRYIGLQTNGVEYDSTVPPVHAGAYAAITVLKTQENVGMDVALVTIAPAKSDISVTGGTVAYNGKKQTATVKAESPNSTVTSPDYTLISGTVDISAGVQNVGLESLCGDVNIDLPNWLDNVLAKTEFNRVDADVASVATFISEYRNDLLKLIPELMLESTGMSNETVEAMIQKLNGGIDELLKVLTKLPDDVNLTFESNKGYTELGSYFYYGIVTDSDHIPAADTGLLVIEPAEITSVDVTTKHVYDGKEQTATVVVKVGEVELPEDCYTVSGNVATEAGKYTVTVVGKGNYTGKVTADWTIEKADATVTINNASKVYGEEDPKFTATITGLKGDDKLNVVFSREAGQDVGEYVISATIAADDAVAKNYNITIKTGILTITQKDITTGDGYPIYFQPGDANGMIKVGTTVYVDDVAYILDENCVAWAADKNRELAIGYVYKNSGNHTTDHAYSDTTKNMYIWDLQWNEETKSYKADRVEELDNLLSFAGGSIWLGSDGVNGIRTYYSTTADTEAVKGAFRNLGYEVVTHGVVVGWADKLNGSEPVPNGNNSAAGHSAGNGTFYDEIYPAADKYITPDLRARFYVELKNIETSESKIIYSGSVERSIGYIAYQNIGRVDAQYQPYVKAILDKAAAAGFTYGG